MRHESTPTPEERWLSIDESTIDHVVRFSEMSGGETVTPGAGCSFPAFWAYPTVECPTAGVVRIEVSTLDGNDRITGNTYTIPSTIDAGTGNDRIEGLLVNARLVGGEGDDWLGAMNVNGATEVVGGTGRDTAYYGQRFADLTISLDGAANDGEAGEGDNVMPDIEVVYGGHYDDTITGSDGAEELLGEGGTDHLIGGGGADRLVAGWTCDDQLEGGAGNDVLIPQGRSVVDGGDGDDRIAPVYDTCGLAGDVRGGDGQDTLDLNDASVTGVVTISLDDVANDGDEYTVNDNIHSDVENVLGTSQPDHLVGSSAANRLDGRYGDDLLDGGGGPDELVGGADSDVADYSGRLSAVAVDLDAEVGDDGAPGEGDTAGTDLELLWGGGGDDTLTGNGADNLINGGPGADRIAGGDGIDVADYSDSTQAVRVTLDGQHGDGADGENDNVLSDVEDLLGGAGNDVLTGSAADNVFDGGPGADSISGGAGIDAVDYSLRAASVSVDLSANDATDGEAGEQDAVGDDVEGVFAGSGDDILVGNVRDGFLYGGAGADRLTHSGGQDLLAGDLGADTILARDDSLDQIECGGDTDTVTADLIDVTAECETVDARALTPQSPAPPNTAPSGTGTSTGTTPPSPRPPPLQRPPDRTPPTGTLELLSARRMSTLLKRGLALELSCSEDCSAIVLLLPRGGTRKTLTRRGLRAPGHVARKDVALGSGAARKIRLVVPRRTRRLLRTMRGGSFAVVALLTDRAGNRGEVRLGTRLTR